MYLEHRELWPGYWAHVLIVQRWRGIYRYINLVSCWLFSFRVADFVIGTASTDKKSPHA